MNSSIERVVVILHVSFHLFGRSVYVSSMIGRVVGRFTNIYADWQH